MGKPQPVCRGSALSIWLVALLLVAGIAPVSTSAAAQTAQPETDNTLTHVQLDTNGSAEWTVTVRTRLDTDERVAEYEAFQSQFRANTSRYLDPFRERMRGVVANAAGATGREMRATNFTASTNIQEVPRRWGVVSYRFTWTNFAAQRDGGLVVGDVFQGGFFLAGDDTLELEAPGGYAFEQVEPTPASRDSGQVTWVGREDFTDEHPSSVAVPDAATDGADGENGGPETTGVPGATGDGTNLGLVLGGVLLVGVGGVAGYVLWRRDRLADALSTPDAEADASSTPPSSEPDGGAVATAPGSEIVTDPERVERLLRSNDGRLRQAAIADEFDWSASKTSRVVGDMVDADTVEKLQLGRENVISLADSDESSGES
ncbi:helix-turn-helix transcriptional regulator [Haloarchaeobius salinus]|uniref:helix-turn-helix transcriptional regulator n=1 Tax=Haloarchaeobius salinus TaxID=1198298 RepID=UPI00210D327C|nr:hypothetical protein [Haloarchaeobius salinus]